MSKPRSALVIVDVQRAFDVPPRLVADIARYARRFGCRIFTRFVNPPGSLFRRWLKQKSCLPGSPDTELLIPPVPSDLVFDKNTYGLAPGHVRQLHRRGIRRV